MNAFCVDTHVLVWHLSRPKRLGRRASRALRAVDADKSLALIPAIVPIELNLLREAGRNVIGPGELRGLLEKKPSFRLLGMDLRDAAEFALLRALQDPFDRLVVAAARVAGVPLITADERIVQSGLVETIWD